MEARIREIQPMIADTWTRYDHDFQDSPLIQPVTRSEPGGKSEGVGSSKTGQGKNPGQGERGGTQKLVQEVQSYLENLNIQLSFSIHDKTGEMVVRVLDRETGDVIRQLPPEELLDLRDKLKELRGVLFDKKA